jgi:hypothetical protein
VLQLLLEKKVEKKQHEEMRRIKTVEVMEHWSNSLKRETSFAEKIVEGFTDAQCRDLYFKKPIELDIEKGRDLCQICTECKDAKDKCEQCISGNKFKLTGAPLAEFRWYVIGYLNMLESVMTAWKLKIVDTDEIENQFQYLYNPEQGWNALEPFRKAAGGEDAYPNIDEFMKSLEEKKRRKRDKSVKKL